MKIVGVLLPFVALAMLGVGVGVEFGWPLSLIVVGGAVWIDGYVPDGSKPPRRGG